MTGSSHIVIRRNLCAWPNRWANNTGIKLSDGTTHSLVEENELYDFHRNGISFHGEATRFNVLRRNYVSRGVPHLGRSWGPNDGIVMYRGADNIVENNIVEFDDNQGHGFGIWGERNLIVGNIAFRTRAGFPVVQGWRPHSGRADGSVLKHNLAWKTNGTGFYTNSVQDVLFINNTAIGAGGNGLTLHNARAELRGEGFRPSARVINHLSAGNAGFGFEIRDPAAFSEALIDHSLGWSNGQGTWGPGTEQAARARDIDPALGPTPIWIPGNSPLRRRGQNGADIGANLLYRYEGGALTSEPLWDPKTGAFPHGAVIRGINDTPDTSLATVHERLNVAREALPY